MTKENGGFTFQNEKTAFPDGKNGISGMGETFAHQAFTGGMSYTVPIPVPEGRRLTPDMTLYYSSGNGNGIWGQGFSGIEYYITRSTAQGIPVYSDEEDLFLKEDGRELIMISEEMDEAGNRVRRYRPETDSQYEKITYIRDKSGNTYWIIVTPEHKVYRYGISENGRLDGGDIKNVFRWFLEQIEEPNGEKVTFQYVKDSGYCYLDEIVYGNYYQPGTKKEIPAYRISFDYGGAERRDIIRSFRGGFEMCIRYLCRKIEIFHCFSEDLGDRPVLEKQILLEYEETKEVSCIKKLMCSGAVYEKGILKHMEANAFLTFQYEPFAPETYKQPCFLQSPFISEADVEGKKHTIFCDMFGDGISGMLTIFGDNAFYARGRGDGVYGEAMRLEGFPKERDIEGCDCVLKRIEGNSKKQMVVLGSSKKGFYMLSETGWEKFRSFSAVPNELDRQDKQFIDMNGSGRSDLVFRDESGERFYTSKGIQGFDAMTRTDGSGQYQRVSSDETRYEGYAGIFGDHLYHRVSVRGNEVFCSPNIGYGRFQEEIRVGYLEGIQPIQAKGIYFADLNGNGSDDIIYRTENNVFIYFNQCGNGFSKPLTIELPKDSVKESRMMFADIYGNGSDCLVIPARKAVSGVYVYDFTGGKRPHLMIAAGNHAGRQEEFFYDSTARLAAQEREKGRAWMYAPEFPIQALVKTKTMDRVAGVIKEIKYQYRDGWYDDEKRKFQGFRFVTETMEPEDGSSGIQKIWEFFTGNPAEFENAMQGGERRSFIGKLVKEKQYGIKKGVMSDFPDYIKEYKYTARRTDEQGIWDCLMESTIHYQYDGCDEARKSEHIVLKYDEFGLPVLECKICYPRERTGGKSEFYFPGQYETYVDVVRNGYLHLPEEDYSLGIPLEEQCVSYQALVPWDGKRFCKEELLELFEAESVPKGELTAWKRHYYWDLELSACLPFGQAAMNRVQHHEEEAVLSEKTFEMRYKNTFSEQDMNDRGIYFLREGYWWRKSATAFYSKDRNGFCQLVESRYVDMDSQPVSRQKMILDCYGLFYIKEISWVSESIQLTSSKIIDYLALQPSESTDVNGNITQFQYDGGRDIKTIEIYEINEGERKRKAFADYQYERQYREDGQIVPHVYYRRWIGDGQEDRFAETYLYYDSRGNVIQQKLKIEEGVYQSDGKQVYNGMGSLWKQYAPFITENTDFEEPLCKEVISCLLYDSQGRCTESSEVRRFPLSEDFGKLSKKIVYRPWEERYYDVGDLITDSLYYKEFMERWEKRKNTLKTSKEEDEEWTREYKILQTMKTFWDTPSINILDSRGNQEAQIEVLKDSVDSQREYVVTEHRYDAMNHRICSILPETWKNNQSEINKEEIYNCVKEYDLRGNVIYESRRDGGEDTFFYNAKNHLIWQKNVDGIVTINQFDWIGRITESVCGKIKQSVIYGECTDIPEPERLKGNLNGNIAFISGETEKIARLKYDCFGKCLEENLTLHEEENTIYTFSYTYDSVGQMIEKTLPDGTTLTWEHDFMGRVIRCGTKEKRNMAELKYNHFSNVIEADMFNGTLHQRVYDNVLNVLQNDILWRKKEEGQKILSHQQLYMDPIGNPVSMIQREDSLVISRNTIVSPEKEYVFDSLSRLIKASGRKSTANSKDIKEVERYEETYSYDLNSNMVLYKRKCSDGFERRMEIGQDTNRCISMKINDDGNPMAFLYDQSGNMLKTPGIEEIQWDEFGRAEKFQICQGGLKQQVGYSVMGERRKKVTRRKLADGNWEEEDIIYLNEYTKKRIWREHNGEKELVLECDSIAIETGMDKVIEYHTLLEKRIGKKKTEEGRKQRVLYGDYLGSAAARADANGEIIIREEYYPYGDTAFSYGTSASKLEETRFRYMGKEQDATGLYYFGTRYYLGIAAKWISQDDTEEDGLNLYCFVRANPIRFADRTGRCGGAVARVGQLMFRKGDLLYGLANQMGRAPVYNAIAKAIHNAGKEHFSLTIDELNNMFLGTGNGAGRSLGTKYLGKVHPSAGYDRFSHIEAEKFKDYLEKKISIADLRAMDRDTRVDTACRLGMDYAKDNGRTVHYILDGIDMEQVLRNNGTKFIQNGFTNSELRHIFQNQNLLKDVVRFYKTGQASVCGSASNMRLISKTIGKAVTELKRGPSGNRQLLRVNAPWIQEPERWNAVRGLLGMPALAPIRRAA